MDFEVDNENKKGPKARASKLEFKMVNETYISQNQSRACVQVDANLSSVGANLLTST